MQKLCMAMAELNGCPRMILIHSRDPSYDLRAKLSSCPCSCPSWQILSLMLHAYAMKRWENSDALLAWAHFMMFNQEE